MIWNFAPVPPISERAGMAELLQATDVLVVNEHEALAVAEIVGVPSGDDYLKAAAAVTKDFGPTCIVTAGAQGAMCPAALGTLLTLLNTTPFRRPGCLGERPMALRPRLAVGLPLSLKSIRVSARSPRIFSPRCALGQRRR